MPMNPTSKWLAIGIALALAWALFLATSGRVIGVGALKPPSLETAQVKPPADFSWTLTDLDGNTVKFSDYKGRPILLNVWATWCPPCLKEMPSLAKLAENPRVKKTGVAILCVSIDESPADLKNFLTDRPWQMTMLRATTFPLQFQTESIPATFLIAPDGQIVTAEVGAAQWDDISVVEFLEKLK